MCARVMPTMSSSPACTAWRAVATSGIFAAWKVGIPVAALTAPAKSRCGAFFIPCTGITSVIAGSVWMRPRMTFRKSTMPLSARRLEISMPSSGVMPPASASSAV